MIKGFKMKLYPGMEAEYEKRHNQLWPEMKDMIHEHGGKNYTIFLDRETLTYLVISRSKMRSFGQRAQTLQSTASGGISWQISWRLIQTTAQYLST